MVSNPYLLAPNPYHARWCRELFGDSPEAVGGRLFSWLVRPAGPLKTAVQAYFKRVLKAGYTVGVCRALGLAKTLFFPCAFVLVFFGFCRAVTARIHCLSVTALTRVCK